MQPPSLNRGKERVVFITPSSGKNNMKRKYKGGDEKMEEVKKLLDEIEPGAKVVVKKIDGGRGVLKYLKDMGITEGTELNVVGQGPGHEHRGAILIKVDGREVVLGQGEADKISVEKEGNVVTLLQLEKGDKGVVKSLEGKEEELFELGIKAGSKVKFIKHLPDQILVFNVEDREIEMGEGLASKILVEWEGKTIQPNFLEKGKKAKIVKVISGLSAEQKIDEMGIEKDKEITLVRREPMSPTPEREGYIRVKVGEKTIAIGEGMAKKIWVE